MSTGSSEFSLARSNLSLASSPPRRIAPSCLTVYMSAESLPLSETTATATTNLIADCSTPNGETVAMDAEEKGLITPRDKVSHEQQNKPILLYSQWKNRVTTAIIIRISCTRSTLYALLGFDGVDG